MKQPEWTRTAIQTGELSLVPRGEIVLNREQCAHLEWITTALRTGELSLEEAEMELRRMTLGPQNFS